MNWVEFVFKLRDEDSFKDILIARLSLLGFDSFDETDKKLKGYIDEKKVTDFFLEELKIISKTSFTFSSLENKNWNELWESNFHPIMIGENCFVRAPFHEKKEVKYDVLISPKMAFGTGHHETTRMMILELFNLQDVPKKVLDVGCGTGILSILSEKIWSTKVMAIDTDNWAIENSLENLKINKCVNTKLTHGGIETQEESGEYDLILANINTNVLVQDLKSYFNLLQLNGILILSGFLFEDFLKINKQATKLGLILINQNEEKKWQCVVFRKNG